MGRAFRIATTAATITNHSPSGNMTGMAVIATGFYLGRESRLAGKWAIAFMILLVIASLSVITVELRESSQSPWIVAIGLVIFVWSVTNLCFTLRFLRQASAT